MNDPDIPTLFETCVPRDDVLAGTLEEQQFAAKLASVAFNPEDAADVYREPDAFFDSTYPTGGLRELLTNLVDRFLVSTGHEPSYHSSILCLDTTFGGGKTHDLIAAYHLAESGDRIDDLADFLDDEDGSDLADAYQTALADGLDIHTAVLVGGYVDARNARSDRNDPEAPNTNTLWGEMAYQLYGQSGYERLKEYDRDRNKPGESELRSLFALSDEPVLILIDEIAEYLEDASAVGIEESTLASQTVSFLKSLLEAAASLDHVNIVYSIADDAFGEHAEQVQTEIKDLDSIEARKQRPITPTGDDEVSAVLRNRLFESVDTDVADWVADAYAQFYRDADRTLPRDTQGPKYRELLARHYPLHPTVVETLTEKVDSIPNFQRTRGALKLIARAIHHLWQRYQGHERPNIHHDRHWLRLHDLTPADDAPSGSIKTILGSTLFELVDLDAAIRADIYHSDGEAHAQQEDAHWTDKDLPPMGTHVTTTVLWHSLAIGEQAVGVTRGEFYEAVGHLDVSFDDYDAALDSLTGDNIDRACHYLYDDNRLKFKSEANLIKVIDQYTDNTHRGEAKARLEARLRDLAKSGGFRTELFPETPADLPDRSDRPTLAVLHFETVTIGDDAEIPETIDSLYHEHAHRIDGPTQDRTHRNYVLFVAADARQIDSALETAKRLEGMESLRNDAHRTADLSPRQLDDLRGRIDKVGGLFGEAVRKAYRHLFYPERDGLQHGTLPSVDTNGDTDLVDAVETNLDERIIDSSDEAWAPFWVDSKLWQATKDRMSTEALEKQFARKPGLDFLLSIKPLRASIVRMVDEADYAYWDGRDGVAYWTGDSHPDGWDHEAPIGASDDVRTNLTTGDVRIDDDQYVYEDVSLLLDQQDVAAPAPECRECGTTLDAPVGDPPYVCDDCGGETTIACVDCGTALEPPVESEPPQCEDCQRVPTETSWTHATEMMSASRAIEEIYDAAAAEASEGRVPLLDHLTIEIGGSQPFQHADFLAKHLGDWADETIVALDYGAQSSDGTSRFNATFQGRLEDFRALKSQPETFSDGSQRRIDLTLTVQLPDSVPAGRGDDHPLADLAPMLEDTNLTLQIEAGGPIRATEEVPA
jgi:hypothetical protein